MGLTERDFFEASLSKMCYFVNRWAQEQQTIADQTQTPRGSAPSPSVPATSLKSVLKGLI